MKRFVLINSPIFRNPTEDEEQYLPPLGLGYIATYLEKTGINVEILDCVKEKKSVANTIKIINEMQPEYVGINIFTQNYELVKEIVENIGFLCECFIGGQVVKSIYQDILTWNTKNRLNIIIGEGEFIIPQIILTNCTQEPEIQCGTKRVYRVNKDSIYFPKNISDVFLNRKYMDNEILINHYGENEVSIITSRGCSFDCSFCGGAKSLNHDITTRIRSTESVIEELKDIMTIYPEVQSIRILDDLFLRNSGSIDMANRIFENFPQLSWRGMVHVLSLIKALEKIGELRKGRCKELFIGIESGSAEIRKRINKLGTENEILQVATEILKNGIDLKGYFIYGFPKEKKEDFQKTFDLAMKLKKISLETPGNFRTSVFQFRPYHGTKLYNEIMADSGILHECKSNEKLRKCEGRSQFNFSFGNYSAECDEILNEYILNTQELNEKKQC